MKLNPDCIRDILITVEETTGYNQPLIFPSQRSRCPNLDSYDLDEIMYHIGQCGKAALIDVKPRDICGNINIDDLSPRGHEFLANIRKDTIWNKTKSIGSKIGATSLNAFVQISSKVIAEIIKAEMGLPS